MIRLIAGMMLTLCLAMTVFADTVSLPVSIVIEPSFQQGQIISPLVSVKVQPANEVYADIVSLWHLDGDWFDSSGNGNHGIGCNSATFSDEPMVGEKAASFNGSTDYAVFGKNGLDLTTNFTIVGWIKPQAAQLGGVVGRGNETQSSWEIWYGPDQNILYRHNWNRPEGWEIVSTPSGSVQLNEWCQFAIVYQDRQVDIYLNGQHSVSQPLNSNPVNSTADWVEIGANRPGTDEFFNGLIDEIIIYKRTLSEAEISGNYNQVINESQLPAAPTIINDFTSLTALTSLTLSGTREAGTSIWINGEEKDPLDPTATDWQADVVLNYGQNFFCILARDGNDVASPPVYLFIISDNQPPQVILTAPADGTHTTDPNLGISLKLSDQYAALNLSASRDPQSARVEDSQNTAVAGSWGDNGSDMITFVPDAPLPDETYTVTIAPTDSLGNTTSASFSFTVDTIAPEAPTIDPPGAINVNQITITGGKTEDSDKIIITSTGGTIGELTYPSETTWQVNLSNLPEGTYTLNAHALDVAGNPSETAQATLIVDQTPPTIAISTIPVPVKEATCTVEGSKESGSDLYLNGQLVEDYLGDADWSTVVDLISEGENLFLFTSRDAAGNDSEPAQIVIVRDTQGPSLTASTPPVNGLANVVDHLSLQLGDQWSTVDYTASLIGAEVRGPAGVVEGEWSTDGSQIEFQPFEVLGNGQYTVDLTPVDSLGNPGVVAFIFRVDQNAPLATALTMNPPAPHRAETVQFTVGFNEEMDGVSSPVLALDNAGTIISIDGDAGSDSFTGADGELPNSELWSVNGAGVSIQNNRLQMSGDNSNINSQFLLRGDFDIEVEFDVTGAAEINSWEALLAVRFPDDANPDNRISINRRYSEGHKYNFQAFIDGAYPQQNEVATTDMTGRLRLTRAGTVLHGYVRSDNAWTEIGQWNYGSAPDASVYLWSGNWNELPIVTFWYDNFRVNSGSYIIAGVGPQGGSWLNSTAWQGFYTFSDQTGDGSYSITVAGTRDMAGNEMTEQEIGNFVLDTVAPETPIVTSVVPPATNISILPLNGFGEVGAQIVINGIVRTTIDAAGSWSYSYSLKEGSNNLAIVARDAAGNDSLPVDGLPVVVLDTTRPLFTINPYPATSPELTLLISGTMEAGAILKLDGVEFADQDNDGDPTTWAYLLTLQETGLQGVYVFSATDAQQNQTERTVIVTYDAAAPVALPPGALQADGAGNGQQVFLSWLYDEPMDLAYYRIYVSQNAITDLSGMPVAGTVNRGTKTFTVNDLTLGTLYYFAVEPVDGTGNSVKTPVVSASATPVDVEAPEDIRSLSASVSYEGLNSNSVTLSWSASLNSIGDLADQILYTDDGNGYGTGLSLGAAVVQHQISELPDNSIYRFKITTKDGGDHESSGIYVNVATALDNPQDLTAAPGKNRVTLSWQPVYSSYLKVYKIYRQTSEQPFTDVDGMVPFRSLTGTGFVDETVDNGTTYQYAVTAENSFSAEKTLVSSVAATPREEETGPVIDGPKIVESSLPLVENHVLVEPVTLAASATDSESSMGQVKLFIDGVEEDGNVAAASYFWNLVEETDGTHEVKVQAFDSVGNLSEVVRSVEVSLAAPSSDPAKLRITSPLNNALPTSETIAVAGIAPQFTSVTLKVNGLIAGTTQVGQSGTFSFAEVPLISGSNSLQIMAAHRGGESGFTTPIQVIYDTGAPPAPETFTVQVVAGGKLQFSWQTGVGETPTGYNLYAASESFTDIDGLTPVNGANPILYLFKEYLPADDAPRYYAVTALDASGNESDISNVLQAASDRAKPVLVSAPAFLVSNQADDGTAGPGTVTVTLAVTEPLAEIPFFSLEPTNGSPIVVTLQAGADDLSYQGSFLVTGLSPHGPTSYNFSAKDLVGNRNTLSGTGLTLDTRGPQGSIAGLDEYEEAAGAVTLTLSFDEVPQQTPTLQLQDSQGEVRNVVLTPVNANTWNGDLNLDGLAEGYAAFQLAAPLTDALGNSSSAIVAGASTQLYVGTPPAPPIPGQLAATTRSGGEISLVWQVVAQATGYRLYRREAGAGDLDWQQIGGDQPATNHYDDTPPLDGFYEYAVTSLGLLGSESEKSSVAEAESDRTPPEAPDGLNLQISGNGVLAGWNAVPEAYGYRLYRYDDGQLGTRVAETLSLQAIDPEPDNNPQLYVVTAVDTLGNESSYLSPQQIEFEVLPPASLVIKQNEGGKPELSWSGTGTGFFIYRNGSKINSVATTVTGYTDMYYSGDAVQYGVSQIDDSGLESPVRSLTLPTLQLGVAEGTSLRRGILENIPIIMQSATSLTVAAVKLQVGSQAASTVEGPFALSAAEETQVQKVAAADLSSLDTVGVLCTAIMEPNAGSRVEISRTSTVQVTGSGGSLEIFNDPLVRGTTVEVRLQVNNLGSARMDLVTSRNGGASDQIRILLKDEDGNLLGQGYLKQRSGTQVFDSDGYATARIEPGTSFLSAPISIQVPASAPYRVILEAQIDQSYYHYAQVDQVVAPGLLQKQAFTIADVSYRPEVQVERAANAQGDKVFQQGEVVSLTGLARATADGSPMPYVPVRIGVAVGGFDRFYTVSSDASGQFQYDFQPGSNEVGHYTVWANHPDLSDRSVQDSFDVIAMRLSPERFTLKMARGGSYSISVKLSNLSGADLTGLEVSRFESYGLTVDEAQLPAEGSTLAGGGSLSFKLVINADSQAPDNGTVTLTLSTAEGLSRTLTVNVSCFDNIPIISTSPSYIDAGLKRGTQQIKTFSLSNRGLAELQNARITAPSLSWIKLAIDPNLGNLAVNESRSIGLLLQPGLTLAPGAYNDRIIIESDNHIPYTYNIAVMVTSDAVGSVLFDVIDELTDEETGNYRDVVGANITLQNQAQPQLIYSLKTGSQGTAGKTDIPEGRYSYRVSAAGHRGYSGTLTITPGLTITVPIALEVTLVEVEWSVTEVVIEDRYEITISQTFETNVPTSVLVVEPPGVNIPDIQPGEVYNGEFTITNYGLISATYKGSRVPSTVDDYEIEMLGTIPEELKANQRVVVPYRVTRKAQ